MSKFWDNSSKEDMWLLNEEDRAVVRWNHKECLFYVKFQGQQEREIDGGTNIVARAIANQKFITEKQYLEWK